MGQLVDNLDENEGGWPPTGKLRLTGFVYEGLGPQQGTLDQRLAWIRRQLPDYSPQPYEQLAAVCRTAGREREARRVLIPTRTDLRKQARCH